MRRQGPTSHRPWLPAGLVSTDVSVLSYVVVDKVDPEVCGLTVSRWPKLDASGRMRLDLDRTSRVAVPTAQLAAHLSLQGEPRDRTPRALRIGDVFGVRVLDDLPLEGNIIDPASWMGLPVIELTPDATSVATAAFVAAITPPLRAAEEEIIDMTSGASEFVGDQSPPRAEV